MDLYTNSGPQDVLRQAFYKYTVTPCDIKIATAFFTYDSIIKEMLAKSCRVQIITRLDSVTSPQALEKIIKDEGVQIRYFTSEHFHPKFYIFGNQVAIIGSANLTEAGLQRNSEVCVTLSSEDIRFPRLLGLFKAYWQQGSVLTREKLTMFRKITQGHSSLFKAMQEFDKSLKNALGDVAPTGIEVGREEPPEEKAALEDYERVYQEFLDAYRVVERVYSSDGRRKQPKLPLRIEIDQFFSFLREEYAPGEEYLKQPIRHAAEQEAFIRTHLPEWFKSRWEWLEEVIPPRYGRIMRAFASPKSVTEADDDSLFDALDVCHAFHDRFRFFGGLSTMKKKFLMDNEGTKLRQSLAYLGFGADDYIDRMGRCIYDDEYKLRHFGRSSVQELYGWINTENIPICNGRTVKALRYLGFDVVVFT